MIVISFHSHDMEAQLVPVKPCAFVFASDAENGTACDCVRSGCRDLHFRRNGSGDNFFIGPFGRIHNIDGVAGQTMSGPGSNNTQSLSLHREIGRQGMVADVVDFATETQHGVNGFSRARGVWQ